jgi:hypothetical protein
VTTAKIERNTNSGYVLTSTGGGSDPAWQAVPAAPDHQGDITGPHSATVITNDAVTSAKILDGTIAAGDIGTGAVTKTKILANNVTLNRIERGLSVDSGKAIISQGSGIDPVWGYPNRVGTDGTPVTFVKTGTFTFNLPNISGGSVHEDTVTITGLESGDLVLLSHPVAGGEWLNIQGLGNCQVAADDMLAFRVWNSSTSNIDPSQQTWQYIWIRP